MLLLLGFIIFLLRHCRLLLAKNGQKGKAGLRQRGGVQQGHQRGRGVGEEEDAESLLPGAGIQGSFQGRRPLLRGGFRHCGGIWRNHRSHSGTYTLLPRNIFGIKQLRNPDLNNLLIRITAFPELNLTLAKTI
jgi:hypothetical protein